MESIVNSTTRVIILAAGDGTRMKSELPKVMHQLKGKPLIEYVVKAAEDAGFGKPIVVVSAKHTLVQEKLGGRAEYVVQKEQLGTGHALSVALPVAGACQSVVVLYGDMPLVSVGTIQELAKTQKEKNPVLTMATIEVGDHAEWNHIFTDFSRIVRDASGSIIKDVQVNDATPEELRVSELNPCYLCFRTDWVRENLQFLEPKNNQGELYLTDLLERAIREKKKIETIKIDPKEAIGINTPEGLKIAEKQIG